MTGEPGNRILWQGPVLAWFALMVLFGINFGASYLSLGAGNLAVNLLAIGVMLAVLATSFMDLPKKGMIVRLVAGGSLFWLLLMFTLTFCDYLSRYY